MNSPAKYTTPSVSVLIRTYNSEKTLDEVLTALDFCDLDECIIVDSGSTDSTLDIAARHRATILRVDPPFNYSRSLNAGFEAAHGEYVLVLSSHCIPLRHDLIERMRHAAATSDDDIAVIYGRTVLHDSGPASPHIYTGSQKEWTDGRFVAGGNGFACYPRRLWTIRPFSEQIATAEDLDWLSWALKSGLRASVVADAQVLYRNQGGLAYMFRKGWSETILGRSIQSERARRQSHVQALKSLAINSMHLTRLLLSGNIGIPSYMRMLAHGFGSSLASASKSKESDGHSPTSDSGS